MRDRVKVIEVKYFVSRFVQDNVSYALSVTKKVHTVPIDRATQCS